MFAFRPFLIKDILHFLAISFEKLALHIIHCCINKLARLFDLTLSFIYLPNSYSLDEVVLLFTLLFCSSISCIFQYSARNLF